METRPRVLLVDDERELVEALSLGLRRAFSVTCVTSARAALEALAKSSFAVIVSDMRMPGMDGTTLLARVRELHPDTVRVLLTGHADLSSAISSVNEGGLFRFLTKPCPVETVKQAVDAAVRQHELVMSERVLLQETLRGSIKVLTDVLALSNPMAFGRASRAKRLVGELAARMGVKDVWQVEVAAQLSQLGFITLPPSLVERHYDGEPLDDEEEKRLVHGVPLVAEQLLSNIPRLEHVRAILAEAGSSERTPFSWGGRALRLVLDYDVLETRGFSPDGCLEELRKEPQRYDQSMIDELAKVVSCQSVLEERLFVAQIAAGMTFAEDVRTRTGTLLISRGYEATDSAVDRLRHFAADVGVMEPILMLVAAPQEKKIAAEPAR